MPNRLRFLRRPAAALALAAAFAAAAAPGASAPPDLPRQALDPLHALGLPVGEPWLTQVGTSATLAARRAAFARALGPVIQGPETKVECVGNGTGGKRVQVMYVHDADTTDDYAAHQAEIGAWALGADRIYRESAAKTGGTQHIRFVHDAACNLSILDVVVDDPDDLLLGGATTAYLTLRDLVQAQGFTQANRKYAMFVDHVQAVCGVAAQFVDDQPGAANANNGGGAQYARIDFQKPLCFTPDQVMAHEVGHDLGAVQASAPNSNGLTHCTDEYDLMCENEYGGLPTTIVCPDASGNYLLDCNDDDYFNAHPAPASYLDTHWNVADSDFLASSPESQWGFVKANDPTAASYTPTADHNQNSTNAKNTIVRTATGVYSVTFTNLANFGGEAGTVLVTSLGTMGEHCGDSAWSSYGTPDTTVTVRCFSAAGAPVDAQFDAAYIRPTSSPGDFAYLWLNDETTGVAAFVPSTFHQFNSAGGTNTSTRNAVGDYTVRLPGMSSDGGTAKVTEFSAAASFCKIETWSSAGADELVEVRCFNSTGAAVDSKFTLVWADSQSILSDGAESAYVYSTNATPAPGGYTPPAATNFNSSGALNTVVRNSTGSYRVTVPNLGSPSLSPVSLDRGAVHVTATTATSRRCEVTGWSSPTAPPGTAVPVLADVTCTTSAGALADSKFV